MGNGGRKRDKTLGRVEKVSRRGEAAGRKRRISRLVPVPEFQFAKSCGIFNPTPHFPQLWQVSLDFHGAWLPLPKK